MDFGCSRHMTESSKWFSSLVPVIGKEYITFRDKSRGKVVSHGTIRVNESFIFKDVALVSNLHFNLLLVLQLLEDDYEVRFKKGLSRVLDARGDAICQISPFGRVFCADFSHSSGPSRCLLTGSSSSLWKWHRRLGHCWGEGKDATLRSRPSLITAGQTETEQAGIPFARFGTRRRPATKSSRSAASFSSEAHV
jgi:hypothetical protein